MFMTIEKYQKNWTFTIISDFGKYSVKIRSQPKFGRTIRFRFNRNRILSNDNSASIKGSRIFGFGSGFGRIIRLRLLFTNYQGNHKVSSITSCLT